MFGSNDYEIGRVVGKREMLWTIQKQFLAALEKGNTIDLNYINQFSKVVDVEEMCFGVLDNINSEITMDMINDSKSIAAKIY